MPNWSTVQVVVDKGVRALCVKAYAGHAKGCPNFNEKPGCPPQAPMIEDVLDLSQPVFAIWNFFDMAGHVAKMKAKHPDWSDRQLRCCLYWQAGARKKLKETIRAFLREQGRLKVVGCPEACGVNVTETMKSAGIILEWPPVSIAYQVVLAGCPRRKTDAQES